MRRTDQRRPVSTRAIVALVVVLFLAASTVLLYRNTRNRSLPPAADSAASPNHGPVYSIVLPRDERILVPLGPNSDKFDALCMQCHSLRLVLNQPHLPEKKWGEVVHKMVAAYGAALSPEKEKDVVVYLNSIRGLKSDAEPTQAR